MENVDKLLHMTFCVFLFSIGLILMSYEAKAYHDILTITGEMFKEKEIYQQYNFAGEKVIPYSELIASLLQPLDYDIIIDEVIIRKDEHNPESINSYNIRNATYVRSYQNNEDGTIARIIYSSTQ